MAGDERTSRRRKVGAQPEEVPQTPPPQLTDWSWLLQTLMGLQKTVGELSQSVQTLTRQGNKPRREAGPVRSQTGPNQSHAGPNQPQNLRGGRCADRRWSSAALGAECGERRDRCCREGGVAPIGRVEPGGNRSRPTCPSPSVREDQPSRIPLLLQSSREPAQHRPWLDMGREVHILDGADVPMKASAMAPITADALPVSRRDAAIA